jgi:SWI/SNF-related matrix-associated actin-dependent regulator of chromatin subfamily A member 5
MMMQLRKACLHPYVFEGVEETGSDEFGEHLVENSGKLKFLDKLMPRIKKEKEQVLIFSQFKMMLDVLEDYLTMRGYKYCRLDGETELEDRELQIEDFSSPNTDKTVFLISTRAGGLGINLVTANHVVIYDSDFNPQIDLQAMDRCYRIGQKKEVYVYRLVTKDTIEEKIIER